MVFRGLDRYTGRTVAIKAVPEQRSAKHEIKMLRVASQHPCIVEVYDAFIVNHVQYTVMELMPGGSALDLAQGMGGIHDRIAAGILCQVLTGLQHLHSKGIVHRDIKPDNILMTHEGKAKISDLGLSSRLEDQKGKPTAVGTFIYFAPEVFESEKQGRAADIWAIGVTTWCLLKGQLPHILLLGSSQKQLGIPLWGSLAYKLCIEKQPIDVATHGLSASAHAFISACLRMDPQARPTAEELLASPFIGLAQNPNPHLVSHFWSGHEAISFSTHASSDVMSPTTGKSSGTFVQAPDTAPDKLN